MNFLNFALWNINGFSKEKKKVILTCAESFKLNLVILLETHKHSDFGFNPNVWNLFNIPSKNKGISILYKKALNLTVVNCKSRFISFTISLNDRQYSFLTVYGGHSKKHKSIEWWSKFNLPSFDVICGDFNLAIENLDRVCGNESAPAATRIFLQNQLDDFFDPGLKERKMTFYVKGRPTSRIDRIYIRNRYSHFFQKLEVLSSGKDHALLFCKLSFAKSNPKSWKFRSHIFNHKKYDEIIYQAIAAVPLTPDWCSLKKEIIDKVSKLQRKLFAKQQEKKYKLLNLLRKIPKNSSKYPSVKFKLESLLEKLEHQRKILKGVGDFKFKDLPSSILSNCIKKNEADKKIPFILNDKDQVVDDQKTIREEFTKFYSELYSKNDFDKEALDSLLQFWIPDSSLDLSYLDDPITMEEAIAALKACNPKKASGCDGLSYRVLKNLPNPHLEVLVHNFNRWLSGKELIPFTLKEGVVVTIPKKNEDPHVIANRRPITLLNVDYKLLSKILTARLSKCMGSLIDKGQVGFMKNRLIFDNIIALNEILSNKKNLVINVDFAKAYDSVNHQALIRTMNHLRFPAKFTNLIRDMIVGSSSKVLVNDILSPSFQIERGVKQGDVISPFLFNLVIEILQKTAIFSPLPLSPPLIFDHPVRMLLYADDVVIPTTNMLGLNNWVNILNTFGRATGLLINKKKTCIISNLKKTPPLLPMPLHVGVFTFLGIKFNCSGICNKNAELTTKIENSCSNYFRSSHNIFTRVSIARSYILPKLWHHAFLLTLPMGKYEKLINKFLWSSKSLETRGRTFVSKIRMKKPRMFGGLGLWDLTSRNDAFLASSLERIMFNNSKCSDFWEDFLSTQKLFKFFSHFSSSPSSFKNPTPSKMLNKLLICWLKTIPKKISNFSEFLQEISVYRDIKQLEKNINLNKDPLWDSILWTPRQLSLTRTCSVSSIFRNIFKIPQRSHALFLWKFMQGGLPFSHDKICSICQCKLSFEHIFFSCIYTLHPAKIIMKVIKLMVREYDLDNHPVAIKPLWNQSFILYHLGSLSHTTIHFHLIVSGLNLIWKLFNKRAHNEWIEVIPSFLHEVCSNMSANYKDIKENFFPSYSEYKQAKETFFLAWRVPALFNKFGSTFSPKQCLLDFLE